MRERTRRWPGVVAILALVAAGTTAGFVSSGTESKAVEAGPLSSRTSIADVTAHALPSVVNISTTKATRRGFSNPLLPLPNKHRATALGSGVIVTSDGTILTNNHVISNATEIKVVLSDGRDFLAKVIGADPKSDLAVLKLQGNFGKLKPIKLGDSSLMRLGEVVLAIGNPFGVGQTVTMGIVSATGRGNVGIVDYEDFIQTDAAINPGNSGGALINMNGELIGIITAILSRSGGYQGIGFAIPTNMAKPIMTSLIASGRVDRGWLGITIRTVDSKIAKKFNLAVSRGVLVAEVGARTPAAKYGLTAGDVVVAVDGVRTINASQLRNRIAISGNGNVVKLRINRNGKGRDIEVKLGALPKSMR